MAERRSFKDWLAAGVRGTFRCVLYYVGLIFDAGTHWKTKTESVASWVTLLSPLIVGQIGKVWTGAKGMTNAISGWLGPLVLGLVGIRLLWVNFKKAAEQEAKLSVRVNVHHGVIATNLVTLNLQAINLALQEAVWLTFSLGLRGSDFRWHQSDKVKAIREEKILGHIGTGGPLRDPGMDTVFPARQRLAAQDAIEGWVTFEPAYYGTPFYIAKEGDLIPEDKVAALEISAYDDASGRSITVPLPGAVPGSFLAVPIRDGEQHVASAIATAPGQKPYPGRATISASVQT